MTIKHSRFIIDTARGQVYKPVTMEFRDNRIFFIESPFALKDEIKAMKGAKWHGFDSDPLKQWSVSDCPRNRFQIEWLEGGNPYEWFEQPIREHDLPTDLWDHQKMMVNTVLTLHYQILAAYMGTGKTRSAFTIMEKSGKNDWFWVGPKATLFEIDYQRRFWGLRNSLNVQFMTYEGLVSLMKTGAYNLPQGVIFDEASKLKTEGVGRYSAAQELTDKIRAIHGMEGYAVLMSGTPSPKRPTDIWALAEIAYPGFLREGSTKALEKRLGVFQKADTQVGGHYEERIAWLDEDGRCGVCGLGKDDCRDMQIADDMCAHKYDPRPNEVGLLYERLKGLLTVVTKDQALKLPEKSYVEIDLTPSATLLRLAQAVQRTSMSTIQGLNKLRQLSDGFLYRDGEGDMIPCPTCKATGEIDEWVNPENPDRPYQSIELIDPEKAAKFIKQKTECCHCYGEKQVRAEIRETEQIPCPKEAVVRDYLQQEFDKAGRIGLLTGFQGSVDRLISIAFSEGYHVFRCDGRGTAILSPDGKLIPASNPLDLWKNIEAYPQMAFVANVESGGFGLTLTEANVAIFYSNSYKPEYRLQAEERFHRPGQLHPVKIVDLFHLPSDRRVLEIIRENRKLEKMVLGDVLGDCFTTTKGQSNAA